MKAQELDFGQVGKKGSRKLIKMGGYYYGLDGGESDMWYADEVETTPDVPPMHILLPKAFTTMGTDPEVFLTTAKGAHLPAFKCLPPKTPNAKVFWDGFQAEIRPGARQCLQELSKEIRRYLLTLQAAARLEEKGALLSIAPVVQIPEEILKGCSQKEVELGCQGSSNAYGAWGEIPENPRELPFRFAGGHIHFGLFTNTMPNEARCVHMVKALDVMCGVPTVGMFEKLDHPMRRQFYGLAGEFRIPPHGLEWRTLSNVWLRHPALYHVVFMLARTAAMLGYVSGTYREEFKTSDDEVQYCINHCDAKLARAVVERNKNLYKAVFFKAAHEDASTAAFMWKTMMEGALKAVPDVNAGIVENWTKSSPLAATWPVMAADLAGPSTDKVVLQWAAV